MALPEEGAALEGDFDTGALEVAFEYCRGMVQSLRLAPSTFLRGGPL